MPLKNQQWQPSIHLVTPQDLVTSVSYTWVSSPVLAALGPVTCSDMEWGWNLIWFRLEYAHRQYWETHQLQEQSSLLLSFLPQGKALCLLCSWVNSRLSTAILLVSEVLQPAKEVYLPFKDPMMGPSYLWLSLLTSQGRFHTCIHSFPLSFLPEATQLLFFPSFPTICGFLLQPWLYRGLSGNFQSAFSENGSTYRFQCFHGKVSSTSSYSAVLINLQVFFF